MSLRPRGGVVTQRSAKPFTPVQFRAWPPAFAAPQLRPGKPLIRRLPRRSVSEGGRNRICVTGFIGASCFQSRRGFVIGKRAYAERASSFPGSSAVEQPAVNRLVAGSNPARGAKPSQVQGASRGPRAPGPGLLGQYQPEPTTCCHLPRPSGLRATTTCPHHTDPRPPSTASYPTPARGS